MNIDIDLQGAPQSVIDAVELLKNYGIGPTQVELEVMLVTDNDKKPVTFEHFHRFIEDNCVLDYEVIQREVGALVMNVMVMSDSPLLKDRGPLMVAVE